jgi:2-polyprenyl-3-methyl-5-hydroxy-6-metoxy-1,4-benzoquinol methylase
MKIYFDVYAVQLTEENIPQIIEKAAQFGWTFHYDMQDNFEFNAKEGFDSILYMKLVRGTTEIAAFVHEPYNFSKPDIRLIDETDPKFGIFHKFKKI